MKLSDVSTKLTCMKSNVVRALTVTAIAGAFLTAAAPAAQAQHFGIGVQIGGPQYYAPPVRVYEGPRYGYGYGYGYDLYAQRRFEEQRERAFRDRQAYIRHEEWAHAQRDNSFRREDGFRHDDGFHHDDYRR